MSDDMDPERDDGVQAAEYALHLMSPADRAAFEARLDGNGALRAEVARWSEAFADLAADIEPVAPPGRIRNALERATARTPPPRRTQTREPSFLGWLAGLGAGIAVSLCLVLAVLVFVNRDTLFGLSPPIYIAEMQADDSPFRLRAGYHPDEAVLVVARSEGEVAPGRVLQLWLIAPGADAPVSLGVLPDRPRVDLVIPEPLRGVLAGATLAISDEPPGGSPTGAPTGDVLAAGSLDNV